VHKQGLFSRNRNMSCACFVSGNRDDHTKTTYLCAALALTPCMHS
jgi:hypothetical protein